MAPQGDPVAEPIRIANCSGFLGDRPSAAVEMVEGGPIDVLTGDWLAELTMLILTRIRLKKPGGGFAAPFVKQMEQVMGTCLDRGIKVVSNAGGLDPDGCAQALAEVADKLGLAPTIAYVHGDNLMDRVVELGDSGKLLPFSPGVEIDTTKLISANAYLGCWGIVEALNAGADIVITGRVTDAAVVCGPAAWHHGWRRDDLGPLAGAVVAGHVIECSAQATGGNYSFFSEVPGLEHVGFPWAEIAEDGSSVIGKHDGTGGLVSVGTVTSQLLYEIGGPRYFGPDVTARFDSITLEQVGENRVGISTVRGEAPPETLKVATNEIGGYRNEVSVALVGLDIEAKAAVAEAAFWDACPFGPGDFESVTSVVERTDKADPASNEEATATWRLVVKDPDEHKVGRAFTNAMVQTALSSIPGMFSPSGMPGNGRVYGVYKPAVVPAELVPQYVTILEGGTTQVDSVFTGTALPDANGVGASGGTSTAESASSGPAASDSATRQVPLGTLAGTRSGDKGGNANLGVFVRSESAFAWLREFLTTDRLRELLPEVDGLEVDRHEFANLWSLNFVIHGLLQEGVAASTRRDAQAKSLGEWLRARVVDIPDSLLGEDR